ncbi:LytTR family DNA-binding domain-containing protein [Reichenbachiella agarivorans]|uniref:LytTR family DNA-binding domain-containing protein n=1 Tax=Reichenbachiella agarivorans TaxID=2979464 RepID=A0ABY6CRM5_9BACT|nr:LytTR family DNA-binding domain-containing protein [Reichenbachiella agarivorans]UXP33138.1 LytTR family DNA-binding domain-containing protein [Reichenbachiella agarivorans]
MKVLIIEDEKFAQEELKRLLAETSYDIEVLACFESIEETVEWYEENDEPDLIFMDIQLSDGLSFEIFQQAEVTCPIIFTTAFENYAIKAFKVNSIDYLLKPIEKDDLEAAIKKYDDLKNNAPHSAEEGTVSLSVDQVQQLLKLSDDQKDYKKRFIIKSGDRMRHVSVEDIAYFFAEDDYTYLVAKENAKFIISFKLDELVKMLDPNDFFRISRKYIVNIHSVKLVNKYFNSRLEVILQPETKDQILISRVRVPEFLNWLEK